MAGCHVFFFHLDARIGCRGLLDEVPEVPLHVFQVKILVTDDDDVRASLRNIYTAMLRGAKLVLEIETPVNKPEILGRWWGHYYERPDGAKIVHSGFDQSYDDEKHILVSLGKYELVKGGRLLETEWESFILRFWEPEVFAGVLAEAGFLDIKPVKLWGGVEERPPDPGDPQIAFECRR